MFFFDEIKWSLDFFCIYEMFGFIWDELARLECGLMNPLCLWQETWTHATDSSMEDKNRF